MKMKFALMLAASIASPVLAHEVKGKNGGRVVDAGAYHVELVTKHENVEVFVSDGNDKPLPTTGFKATAVFVVGDKSVRVVLEPTTNERLAGKAPHALPEAPRGAVLLTDPAGATAQAKF
jgi:hypothetical protein